MTSLVSDYLSQFDARLFSTSEGRRAVARWDLQACAFIYFRSSLSSPETGDQVTLSEFHTAFCRNGYRLTQATDRPAESREVWTCPRGAGKSTWIIILCSWLAAFEHQSFIALFSASETQATDRLAALRREFDTNALLRKDFPELCRAARRSNSQQISDTKTRIQQSNGFTMVARGIDTSVLGLLSDQMQRPQVLILDDPEGGEGNYSQADAGKRLGTIQDDILPLAVNAHVVWVGTTTRPGGLMHQLVNHALGIETAEWIEQEKFKVRYMPALLSNPDGSERSLWPERWPLEWLQEQKGMRSFAKNYMNLPAPEDSPYWKLSTFRYADDVDAVQTVLSVDPAVSTKRTSDETGISVVSRNPVTGVIVVRHCEGVRLGGEELRSRVLQVLAMYPDVAVILIEDNQGGNTWDAVFHHMPVKLRHIKAVGKKELRFQRALAHYERGRVLHERRLPELEQQMVAYPRVDHDDRIDSVVQAIKYFLPDEPTGPRKVSGQTQTYV